MSDPTSQPKSKYIANLIPTPADNRSWVEKLCAKIALSNTNLTNDEIRSKLLEFITDNFTTRQALNFPYQWDLWARQNQMMPPMSLGWRVWMILAGRGFGKALSLDTPIPSPTGWKTMGELKVGDKIFDETGKICSVTFVTETMNNRDCYEVIFSDGTVIIADAEHQWQTVNKKERNKQSLGQVRTTEQILTSLYVGSKKELNHAVILSGAVEYPEQELEIDPYVFGAWCGDGSSYGTDFTSDDEEITDKIRAAGYVVTKDDTPFRWKVTCQTKVDRGIDGRFQSNPESLYYKLKTLGFFGNKYIPYKYLYSSVEQRLELLKGLMDTDGTIGKGGSCCFDNTNKNLADGVYELVVSLGLKATRYVKRAKLNGKDCGECYRVAFTPHIPVFHLKRKLERQKLKNTRTTQKYRYIKTVNKIKSVPVRCIQVDSPNSLFLASKSYIATHNTRVGAETVRDWASSGKKKRIALVGPTTGDVNGVMLGGEALSIATLIPTPFGFKLMVDIKKGDLVFDETGKPCQVKWVTPIMYDRPCYRVKFSDLSEITADANHKWYSETRKYLRNPKGKQTVFTTAELKETLFAGKNRNAKLINHSIPVVSAPLEYSNSSKLPINPYVLGYWLGDGSAKAGEITSMDSDVIDYISSSGYECRLQEHSLENGSQANVYTVLGILPELKKLNVFKNKHIPKIYQFASVEERKELLRGLMDSDGYCRKNGSCSFSNSNVLLMEGVERLLIGLGLKFISPFNKKGKSSKYNLKLNYNISFTSDFSVFHIQRKCVRQNLSGHDKTKYRKIISIEPIESVPVKCIAVDSPNHLFLAGKECIPTHNSGILSICPPWDMPVYNQAHRRLTWANGSIAEFFTAEEPKRLRGPQFDAAWCLAGFTPILMANGSYTRIKDIEVNDYVQTRYGSKRVTAKILTKKDAKVYELTFDDGHILMGTKEHPVFIKDKGFIQIQYLEEGMFGLGKDNRDVEIVEIRDVDERYDVYDIGVEDAHEFYASSVLVHNCDEICLVADTEIETEFGEMPIQFVYRGLKVWTRNGLKRVARAWKTSDHAPVYKLTTESGKEIIGTAKHPIWVEGKGFIQLANLEIGDTLLGWSNQLNQARIVDTLKSTEKTYQNSLSGTESTGVGRKNSIKNGDITKMEMEDFSIENCISQFLEKFLTTWMFITLTDAPSIMKYLILNCLLGQNILDITGSPILSEYNYLQQKKEVNTPLKAGKTEIPTNTFAQIAERILNQSGKWLNIVRRFVKRLSVEAKNSIQKFAQLAELSFRQLNPQLRYALPNVEPNAKRLYVSFAGSLFVQQTQEPSVVQKIADTFTETIFDKVKSVEPLNTLSSVYNLEVEDDHEYYANGILSSNCSWRYPETWDMLQFGLRLGTLPQVIVTTTPKPQALLKSILTSPTTFTTTGTTFENRTNMAESFFEEVKNKYGNSRLGQQELEAKIMEDVPGALWTRTNLDDCRINLEKIDNLPDFLIVVVAIDPATTVSNSSAETGICVAAYGADDNYYVLHIDGVKESPNEWGKRILALYDQFQADRIVAEVNNGGDLVANVITTIRPMANVQPVYASRGKATRAEPVATLYERKRVHHVGYFPVAEDQMCEFNPVENPHGLKDRVDAVVWAVTSLMEQTAVSTSGTPMVGGLRSKLVNYKLR